MARRSLGGNFARLWTAGTISNLGDGVILGALPLLARSLSRSPTTVALVTAAGSLPWLLFSLISGVIADRTDRRRAMAVVDAFRFAAMGLLGFALIADLESIPLLVIVSFSLGIGETVFDNASQAILPSVVTEDQLETANSRLEGSQIVANQFVGPPLGAWLFTAAIAAPFLIDAASFAAAAALALTLRGSFRPERTAAPTPTVRSDIREGLRWLFAHRLLRSLAIALGVMNLLGMAAMTMLVLYAKDVLHLTNVEFGLLLTAEAAGAVLGASVAPRLARRVGNGTAMTLAIALAGASMLVPGLWSQPTAVAASLALGGFGGLVWNVLTVSLRQQLVPDELLGRVNSAYRLLGWGTMPVGAIAGGLIADAYGLRAPFLVSGTMALLLAVWVSNRATNRSIARARRRAAAAASDRAASGASDDRRSEPNS
ncbi:MAG: MFS transporter [Acidimicrobiia bacterium]|nr:MFS transporter [Acidimicrobiia bacterium]